MEENNIEVKKKNYTVLIIVIVLIIILGGFGTWYLLKSKDDNKVDNTVSNEQKEEPKTNEVYTKTNEVYTKTIEEMEQEISQREKKLLEKFDSNEAVVLENLVQRAGSVIFKLCTNNNIRSFIGKGKLGFDESASEYDKYLYNDLNYAISINNLIQRDETITEEEKSEAIAISNKYGFEYDSEDTLSLNVIGKLEENTIKESYNKYFLASNYVHRDVISIPGCHYLIYSQKYNVYFIYQNASACEGGGMYEPYEAINIEKNDDTVVIEYVNDSLNPEYKFKIYFALENEEYKLANYEVLAA